MKERKFSHGDKVNCCILLTSYIRNGNFDEDQAAPNAPLDDLKVSSSPFVDKWLWITGEGIHLAFDPVDGSVPDNGSGLGPAGYIYHKKDNELPTFGNLKAGDPCPFVVGMEVVPDESLKNHMSAHPQIGGLNTGPFEIKGLGSQCDLPFGVDYPYFHLFKNGKAYSGRIGEREDQMDFIGNVLPATQEQPAPHEYQFGDKVKVEGLIDPRYVFAHSNGLVAVMTATQMGYVKDGQAVTICTAIDEVVSPWPEPVTVNIGLDPEYGLATVHPEGIEVGCQVIRFEAFDKLAAEVAKIRGNE